MPSVLPLTSHAMLVELDDQTIHLYFEGRKFGAGDKVPPRIAGWDERAQPLNAGAFVMMCMVEKYGPDPMDWTDIGRRFLYPK